MLMLVFLVSTASIAGSGDLTYSLDSSVAYYEGEEMDYVIYAPDGFKMDTEASQRDGYSCAFLPRDQSFDSASLLIGINIYKIRGLKFSSVLKQDTASLRKHYGPNISIRHVDSVFNKNGYPLTTFYLNDTTGFLPNVMISYFDGKTELLIFELVISPDALRFKAEETFMECISRFKSLRRGVLGAR